MPGGVLRQPPQVMLGVLGSPAGRFTHIGPGPVDGGDELRDEAKRERPRPRDRDFDLAKLRAYLRELRYRQAAYLEFDGSGGPPRLQWFELQDGQVHATGFEDCWPQSVEPKSEETVPGL